MDARQIQTALNTNGFPCGPADGIIGDKTHFAVTSFQQAYNGPAGWLAVDGIPGPKTQAALAELPHLSANFVVAELACHHCGRAYVRRELLAALEAWRKHLGRPLAIVDAYRCPAHNADTAGSASNSSHVPGLAADPATPAHVDEVQALRLFSGIGDEAGVVRHVDVRHVGPNPTPGATVDRPARWHY
jgi:peptidase M15-like protein/putative peptidoglycan binding protein